MQGLFTHYPIVVGIVEHCSIIDYLVLRQVFPVLIRKPRIFLTGSEIMATESTADGIWLAVALTESIPYASNVISRSDRRVGEWHVSGAIYSCRQLRIRDLDSIVRRTFHVNPINYLKRAFISLTPMSDVTRYYEYWKLFAVYGFTIIIHYDANELRAALRVAATNAPEKNNSLAFTKFLRTQKHHPRECVIAYDCKCTDMSYPDPWCKNCHDCGCIHHVRHRKLQLQAWHIRVCDDVQRAWEQVILGGTRIGDNMYRIK